MEDNKSKDLIIFKILLVGSVSGKSCILYRYCENRYPHNFYATIGIDFRTKTIKFDKYKIKLLIWEIANGNRFKPIRVVIIKILME